LRVSGIGSLAARRRRHAARHETDCFEPSTIVAPIEADLRENEFAYSVRPCALRLRRNDVFQAAAHQSRARLHPPHDLAQPSRRLAHVQYRADPLVRLLLVARRRRHRLNPVKAARIYSQTLSLVPRKSGYFGLAATMSQPLRNPKP